MTRAFIIAKPTPKNGKSEQNPIKSFKTVKIPRDHPKDYSTNRPSSWFSLLCLSSDCRHISTLTCTTHNASHPPTHLTCNTLPHSPVRIFFVAKACLPLPTPSLVCEFDKTLDYLFRHSNSWSSGSATQQQHRK